MFVLLIFVYIMHARQLSWNPIPSEIRSNDSQQHETQRYKSWPAAKAILAITAEVLERLLPVFTYLAPAYEPMVVVLMIGCITLAGSNLQGVNSNKYDRTQAVEDAA